MLALFVACYALSVILFFVTGRYRLPAVPVLLLFAACGVRFLWHRPWPALAAVAGLLVFCNVATGAMDLEGNAHEHYYLGYAYEERDMPAHAARHYRRAIARDSTFAEPLLALAALHGEAKHYGKAIDLYRRYLKTQPNDVDMCAFSSATLRCSLGATTRPRPRTPRSPRRVPTGQPRTVASATPS